MTPHYLIAHVCLAFAADDTCEASVLINESNRPMAPHVCAIEVSRLHRQFVFYREAGELMATVVNGQTGYFNGAGCAPVPACESEGQG